MIAVQSAQSATNDWQGAHRLQARSSMSSAATEPASTESGSPCRHKCSASKRSMSQGDARVIRCLEDSREHFEDSDCKAATFDHIGAGIDFNMPPLKDSCSDDIKENCKGATSGHSQVNRYPQDRKRKAYSDKCKKVRSTPPGCCPTCHQPLVGLEVCDIATVGWCTWRDAA